MNPKLSNALYLHLGTTTENLKALSQNTIVGVPSGVFEATTQLEIFLMSDRRVNYRMFFFQNVDRRNRRPIQISQRVLYYGVDAKVCFENENGTSDCDFDQVPAPVNDGCLIAKHQCEVGENAESDVTVERTFDIPTSSLYTVELSITDLNVFTPVNEEEKDEYAAAPLLLQSDFKDICCRFPANLRANISNRSFSLII